MAAIRKFLFDTDFTVIEHPEAETDLDDAEVPAGGDTEPPAEEEPPSVFSEEDLEVAHGQGFAEGKQEGIREAADAIDRQTADALAQIGARLPELFVAQEKAAADLQRSGLLAMRALARKVLPGLAERDGLDEIDHLARLVLDRLRGEPRIVVRVNGRLGEDVQKRLLDIAARKGMTGSIEVIAEAGMAPGDCRIEWAGGGAERHTGTILDEIDQIIARNLGGTVDELVADAAPMAPAFDPADTDGATPSAATPGNAERIGGEPDAH